MFQAKKPAARMGPPQVPPPPMPPMAHAPFTPVESTEAARATIAHLFGEKYYEILASNPLDSHCFYYDESVLSRSEPHDLSSTPAVLGTAAINHKIMTSGLAHARTDVLSLDHQDTPAGILVMVAGSIVLKGEAASRRFVQTFLLVHRSNSYYIRNDIHRLLDRAPAAAPPPYRAHGAPLQPGLPPLDPVMMAVGAAGSQPRPAPPVPATTHPVQPPPAALVAPRPAPPPAPVAPAEPAAGPAEPHARPAARATRGSGGGGSGAGGGGAGGGGGSGGPKSWASVVGHEPLGDADGEPAHTPPAGGPAAFAEGRHAAAEGAHAGGDAGSARMAPVSAVRADAAGGVDGAVPKVKAEGPPGARGAVSASATTPNAAIAVFVSGVPLSAEEEDLKAAFGAHGAVKQVNWRKDKGFAFVEFATARDAQSVVTAAAADPGILVHKLRVSVEPKRAPQQPPRGGGGGRDAAAGRRGSGRGRGGDGAGRSHSRG